MPSPSFLGDGHTPRRSDTKWVILQKILGAEIDGGGGSGAGNQEIFLNRDPAAPDDPTKPAASYNTTTQVVTWWDGANWQ